MINLRLELENYPIIDLKSLEEKNPNIPDSIKNSIVLYNKALESLRSNSEDIAIIGLKKAVAMNPSFYEAMNLLGLCYAFTNEKSKAQEMFQKVILAENNGILATRYLGEVNAEEGGQNSQPKFSRKETIRKLAKKAVPTVESASQSMSFKIDLKKDYLKYILGFSAGAVIIFLICLPLILNKGGSAAKASENGNTVKQLQQSLLQKENDYKVLNDSYTDLQNELETANQSADYYKFSIKLYEAGSLAAEKKYTEAADLLLLLKTAEFKDTEKNRFNTLFTGVMPKAAQSAYDKGYAYYGQKSFQEAIKNFEKVPLYMENFEKNDAMLYYMGKCYQETNNSRVALDTFTKLVEKYPQSRYAKYAQFRINELSRNP